MVLDVDRFEDFTDEIICTPHKRKSRPTDRKTKEVAKPETPDERVDVHLNKLKLQWSDLDETKQQEKISNYYKWVEISLREKQPLYQESDLDIEVKDKITKITHKPTGYFALSVGLESDHLRQRDAEINLYNRIDRHYKDWTRTSPEFKQKHLNSDRTL